MPWYRCLVLLLFLGACNSDEKPDFQMKPPPRNSANVAGSWNHDLPFRPNILWITAEDLSPRLSCYGDSTAQTPHLDSLAQAGIVFERAFSPSGVCAPSRSAIITGLYPTSYGANDHRTNSYYAGPDHPSNKGRPLYEATPPPEVRCFPEYLRKNGYYCSNNSKEDYQFEVPATVWDESSYQAHWRKRPKGTPFFSVFNFFHTHESQLWWQEDQALTVSKEAVEVPPYYPQTDAARHNIARHYSNIERMDEKVGEILAQLRSDGLMDSTIVVFFGDHGDGLPRAKRWLYESGIRVPLIVSYPDGWQAGNRYQQFFSFLDLAPTTLSMAGIEAKPHMEGRVGLGPDATDDYHDYLFAARGRMDVADECRRAVRDKRFKYIRNLMPNTPYLKDIPYRNTSTLMQQILRKYAVGELNETQSSWLRPTKPKEELYDLEKDPHELNNLANNPQYRDKLKELRQALEDWQNRTQDYGLMPEKAIVRDLWNGQLKQPKTAQPRLSKEGGQLALSCKTAGASIGYKLPGDTVWQVYTGPLAAAGADSLQAFAHRIGYQPSPQRVFRWNTVP